MVLPLRKAKKFIYVVVVGSLAFCTFYWYNFSSGKHSWKSVLMDGSTDYWRWECNATANLCQRRVQKYGDSSQSLKTCQMTCGLVQLWPQPNGEIFVSNKSLCFNHGNIDMTTIIAFNIDVRNILRTVCKIFLKDVKTSMNTVNFQTGAKLLHISIHVVGNRSEIDLRLGVDESYKLNIKNTKNIIRVSIKSGTFFGARHALETLRQLIWYDEVAGCLQIISKAKIVDSPSFSYRGLLLDTSSHYFSVQSIKRTINAMAAIKLNVFHWHLTGSTSFPIAFKNMEHAIYGAYSYKKLYTNADIINIINYAKLRGIKILLEVNNPGDMGGGWNWGRRKKYGDLNICYKNKLGTCQTIDYCSQLNPNNNMSYKLLKDVLQELKNITGYTDINHLGGDVDLKCWIDSPEVRNMDIYKRKGVLGVLKHHQNKMYDIMSDIYKDKIPNVILWSDYFKKFIDPTEMVDSRLYIAQVTSESEIEDEKMLINKGYKVIISHADKWDLSRVPHWSTVYDHRPWEYSQWSQREQILGGEALVWTNFIDEHTLDNTVWPAAAAVAEVLWTDPQIESLSSATLRLHSLRDRLVERGIRPAAISPKWCNHNPGACF